MEIFNRDYRIYFDSKVVSCADVLGECARVRGALISLLFNDGVSPLSLRDKAQAIHEVKSQKDNIHSSLRLNEVSVSSLSGSETPPLSLQGSEATEAIYKEISESNKWNAYTSPSNDCKLDSINNEWIASSALPPRNDKECNSKTCDDEWNNGIRNDGEHNKACNDEKYNNKETTIYIHLDNTLHFIATLFAALSLNLKVVILSESSSEIEGILINDSIYNNLANSDNTAFNMPSLESSFYIKTSGSSGNATQIKKTLNQMLQEAKALKERFNIDSSFTFFASISHAHLYGLTFKIFLPLISGAAIESKQLLYPEYAISFIQDNSDKKLVFLSSPTLLHAFNNHSSLDNLALIFSAGARLLDSIKERLRANLVEIYGSSETGIVAMDNGSGLSAFKEVKLHLSKENTLVIKSPWSNTDNGKDSFTSKDLAEINGDKITLLGRIDRILKVHDKRISLDSIEICLKTHDFIEQCVVSISQNIHRLNAVIVLNKEGQKYFRKHGRVGLIDSIKSHLPKAYVSLVRYFAFVDKLPLNTQGKITKQAIDDIFNKKEVPSFEIVHKDSNSLKARGHISPNCFYFKGHFSSFPLVPGFVEIGFIFDLAKHLNIESIYNIENAKFTSFMQPYSDIEVSLNIKSNKLYFSITSDGKACCNGRIRYV